MSRTQGKRIPYIGRSSSLLACEDTNVKDMHWVPDILSAETVNGNLLRDSPESLLHLFVSSDCRFGKRYSLMTSGVLGVSNRTRCPSGSYRCPLRKLQYHGAMFGVLVMEKSTSNQLVCRSAYNTLPCHRCKRGSMNSIHT